MYGFMFIQTSFRDQTVAENHSNEINSILSGHKRSTCRRLIWNEKLLSINRKTEGKKCKKKYRNSGRIQTECVKRYLLAVTEDVCLAKTNCIKVPAFLFLSLKIKEVMDTVVVIVDYIRQGAKLPIFSTHCARIRFGTWRHCLLLAVG